MREIPIAHNCRPRWLDFVPNVAIGDGLSWTIEDLAIKLLRQVSDLYHCTYPEACKRFSHAKHCTLAIGVPTLHIIKFSRLEILK
jgi:hypothetical protein